MITYFRVIQFTPQAAHFELQVNTIKYGKIVLLLQFTYEYTTTHLKLYQIIRIEKGFTDIFMNKSKQPTRMLINSRKLQRFVLFPGNNARLKARVCVFARITFPIS